MKKLIKKDLKKIFLVLIITLFFFNITGAQQINGTAIYKKKIDDYLSESEAYKNKHKNNLDYYNSVLKIDHNVKQLLENVTFNLQFYNKESIFKVSTILELEGNSYYDYAVGPDGHDVHYFNAIELINLTQRDAYGEFFLIENPKIVWELSNEKKQIGEYTCYKATTERLSKKSNGQVLKMLVEAWYAPEVAIPFGPLGYNGLPGLIMELKLSNFTYYVSKIELNSNKNNKITRPNKGIKVTKEEFDNLGVEQMKNLKKGF